MRKQTELMKTQTGLMVSISKLLADIRDGGSANNVIELAMMDYVKEKLPNETMKYVDKELRKLSDAMEKRWSE